MSKELQQKLKPGDQIIATKNARYPKSISPDRNYSQRAGDIIMVNNPNIGDLVGGMSVTGTLHDGRKKLGLGSSLKVGTFRLATPNDKGFLGTREQWESAKDAEIAKLREQSLWRGCALICCLVAIAGMAIYKIVS